MWFTDFVRRERIDCLKKISNYSTLSEAMRSCSQDSNCFGVSQPCGIYEVMNATKDSDENAATEEQMKRENKNYSTCGELYATRMVSEFQQSLVFEDCETQIFYQKSTSAFLLLP